MLWNPVMQKLTLVAALAVLMLACGKESAPGAGVGQVAETRPVAAAPAKAGWEGEWEKLVAAGRREGRVVVYNTHASDFRTPIGNAFQEKFGIDAEWVSGRGGEIVNKFLAERRAGLAIGDLMIAGVTSLGDLSAEGALDAIEPALVLPAVKDPKAWRDGALYFVDQGRRIMPFYGRTGSTMMINTDLVKPGDVKSYRNLLDPKWKGKILMNDPTASGSGNGFAAALNVIMGADFFRELARQEPVITRDQRQQVEWVARGRYPILLAPDPFTMAEFRKAGAPIKHIIPEEGTWAGAGGGILGLMNKPGHPSAARVFLNWFLSQEGQTVAVKGELDQSRRLDVTTEYIDPDRSLQPGVKYIDGDSDLMIKKRVETRDLANLVFAAQLK